MNYALISPVSLPAVSEASLVPLTGTFNALIAAAAFLIAAFTVFIVLKKRKTDRRG